MKICGISDIHGNLPSIPECDVLCICGDIFPLSIQRDLIESEKWMLTTFMPYVDSINCKIVLLVPGNHDFLLEDLYNKHSEGNGMDFKYGDKIHVLVDKEFMYEGVKFYGSPWINPISFGSWAFEDYSKMDATELQERFSKISKCDILLTHDSPFMNNKLAHYSYGKSEVHLYGHWHQGISNKPCNKYNVSLLNNVYDIKENFKPLLLETEIGIKVSKVKHEQNDN